MKSHLIKKYTVSLSEFRRNAAAFLEQCKKDGLTESQAKEKMRQMFEDWLRAGNRIGEFTD